MSTLRLGLKRYLGLVIQAQHASVVHCSNSIRDTKEWNYPGREGAIQDSRYRRGLLRFDIVRPGRVAIANLMAD